MPCAEIFVNLSLTKVGTLPAVSRFPPANPLSRVGLHSAAEIKLPGLHCWFRIYSTSTNTAGTHIPYTTLRPNMQVGLA